MNLDGLGSKALFAKAVEAHLYHDWVSHNIKANLTSQFVLENAHLLLSAEVFQLGIDSIDLLAPKSLSVLQFECLATDQHLLEGLKAPFLL